MKNDEKPIPLWDCNPCRKAVLVKKKAEIRKIIETFEARIGRIDRELAEIEKEEKL